MALSLHQAIIPNWLQVLGAVDGLLDKAEGYVADGKASEKELLETRLIDDMLPLAYQFKSCWTHTHLALTAVHEGHFSPDMNPYPEDFASLREMIATARKTCEQASEDELEQIVVTTARRAPRECLEQQQRKRWHGGHEHQTPCV